MPDQSLRYSRPWYLIGPLFGFLGVAFPILMWLNHEKLDLPIVVAFCAFIAGGVLMHLYIRSYRVVITEHGFVVSSLWRKPREVRWLEVARVHLANGYLLFHTRDQKITKVSGYINGADALMHEATLAGATLTFG
jgi:hypothetical protein